MLVPRLEEVLTFRKQLLMRLLSIFVPDVSTTGICHLLPFPKESSPLPGTTIFHCPLALSRGGGRISKNST